MNEAEEKNIDKNKLMMFLAQLLICRISNCNK
jgi:hypothetical protein